MSRRLVCLLLFLTVVLLAGCACADRHSGDFSYVITEDREAIVTGLGSAYNYKATTLEIPGEIEGCPVVGLSPAAFRRTESVRKVVLPDSLRSVPPNAFASCGNLKEIVFGTGLRRIEEHAFAFCESLASVELPEGLEYVGAQAFADCSLTKVVFPSTLREIGERAFGGNQFSESLILLPEGLAAVGSRAFDQVGIVYVPSSLASFPSDFVVSPGRIAVAEGHPSLRLEDGQWLVSRTEGEERLIRFLGGRDPSGGELRIPETVTVVSAGALREAGSCSLVIPASLVSFEGENSPFDNPQRITVAEGNPRYCMRNGCLVDTETDTLLCYCPGVPEDQLPERFVIPDGIRAIAGRAFCDQAPAEIVVPEGVTRIGNDAFRNWFIRKLVLPSTLDDCAASIIGNTFRPVTVEVAPGAWNLRFQDRYAIGDKDEVPAPLLKKKSGKGFFLYYLYSDGSCCIADYLSDSENIGAVNVPEKLDGHKVRGIGPGAFRYTGANSVSLPGSVEFIGDGAFGGPGLRKLTLKSPLLFCGRNVIDECQNLDLAEGQAAKWNIVTGPQWEYTLRADGSAEITRWLGGGKKAVVPAEIDGHPVRSVSGYEEPYTGMVSAFYRHSDLQEIVLPEGLETIGAYAFRKIQTDSHSLKQITIPSTVTEIGFCAFSGTGEIKSLTIPDTVTKLGAGCFSGCYSLASVKTGKGVTAVPPDAFSNCYALTSVTFAGSIEAFGDQAFAGTSKLKSLKWPKGLKRIGSKAFLNCALGDVVLQEGLEELGASCFMVDEKYVKGITGVTVPGSLRVIPEYAFAGNTSLKKAVFRGGVEEIGAHAFDSCALASLDLPDSVRIIGDSAFAWNSKLKTLKLKEGLETMADGCFKAHDLSGVKLPASLKSVGKEALVPNREKGSFTITVLGMETELHESAFCIKNWCKDTMKIVCREGSRVDLLLQSGAVPTDKIKVSYLKK